MTPGARVQAAIERLDEIAGGMAAEQSLTRWARGSRFAGSKDRAAVRDHVFDALRRWRSCAMAGGGETGRARMIGLARLQGLDLADLFSGLGHAPAPLSAGEQKAGTAPDGAAAADLPDWILERLTAQMGAEAACENARLLQERAPVDLRVNLARGSVPAAQAALAEDEIETEPVALSHAALRVTSGARKVARSNAYISGLVELQDAASQAVVDFLPLEPGSQVLDYCAGGGGKSLAIAARTAARVMAHDSDPKRMKDIPERAARAGAQIECISEPAGMFDVVFCDAPCSGSGAWRRAPMGKWALSPARLGELCQIQAGILDRAKDLVRSGGVLSYATCSLLAEENADQVAAFLVRSPDFESLGMQRFTLSDGGDGFFVANLIKE